MRCDRIWRNARLATLAPEAAGLGIVEDGLVACRDGLIVYAGPRATRRPHSTRWKSSTASGAGSRPASSIATPTWSTPATAPHEFEQRLNGVTYEAIARTRRRHLSTVNATRAASEAQLVAAALPRLDALLAEGVTTVEIKSGYGLALEHERKQLRAARALAQERAVSVRTTFLGAHALPPEFAGRADDYIDEVCPAHAARAGTTKAWSTPSTRSARSIGFTREQTRRVFDGRARRPGCASNCTPSNCPTCTARRSPRRSTRCRPITWNTSTRRASAPWRRPAPSRCCCPARSISCATRRLPPLAALRAARRADGAGDRLQPGDLASDLRCSWR